MLFPLVIISQIIVIPRALQIILPLLNKSLFLLLPIPTHTNVLINNGKLFTDDSHKIKDFNLFSDSQRSKKGILGKSRFEMLDPKLYIMMWIG